jgi:hypothetical protein
MLSVSPRRISDEVTTLLFMWSGGRRCSLCQRQIISAKSAKQPSMVLLATQPVAAALVAPGGKSRRCNNFDSYGWYKRRPERVDFIPEFDPDLPCCVRLRCGALGTEQVRHSPKTGIAEYRHPPYSDFYKVLTD